MWSEAERTTESVTQGGALRFAPHTTDQAIMCERHDHAHVRILGVLLPRQIESTPDPDEPSFSREEKEVLDARIIVMGVTNRGVESQREMREFLLNILLQMCTMRFLSTNKR